MFCEDLLVVDEPLYFIIAPHCLHFPASTPNFSKSVHILDFCFYITGQFKFPPIDIELFRSVFLSLVCQKLTNNDMTRKLKLTECLTAEC